MSRSKLVVLLPLILVILALSAAACASAPGSQAPDDSRMAPLEDMPAEVQAAPVTVQEAYRFAAANAEILTQIPCYCGCGAMGHASNYACYVSGEDEAGGLVFDAHALGCSICVDITQDTMRLLQEGKSVPDMRAYVDQTYSQYGPSNMP